LSQSRSRERQHRRRTLRAVSVEAMAERAVCMKVVLDARPLSHPQAGGFRSYTCALLQGLLERGIDDLGLLLYVDREITKADRTLVPPGAKVRVLSRNRLKTDLLRFPQAVREDCPDLVHGTMNYLPKLGNTPTTLTVHDAMGVKRYPWNSALPRTPRERFINRYWAQMTRHSAQAARQVVTDSRGAAQEIGEALNLPEERVTVIYPGIRQTSHDCLIKGDRPSAARVLAIASPDPRKNIDLLYRALTGEAKHFAKGISPHLDLVCSSPVSARRAEEAIARYGVPNVRLLRNLDDAALRNAYASAGVFAWPSLREGFGLPPLEAMQSGCPVASSRAPVMPEVLGDAPLYFDPDNPAELAGALAFLLNESPEARKIRVLAGQERARQYTCRRMAEETVAVWKTAGRAPV
ncbi:MAG: glycosyltransferase family 1 protein, partial [Armatimonadota bacterium]